MRHVVLLGEMSELVEDALRKEGYTATTRTASMDEAVAAALESSGAPVEIRIGLSDGRGNESA